ncbi:MAG: alkaline phosphatase family protein, partial [Sphingobacteriales bacterium]
MKTPFIFIAIFLLSVAANAQQRKRKVVYIIADGISADAFESRDLPNFKKII